MAIAVELACLPGEGEGLVDAVVVDEFDLEGAVGVEREAAAGEHQVDLELVGWSRQVTEGTDLEN